MSVRASIAATLASRVYLATVAMWMLPIYLRKMGPEAYGLVALFFVLQVWFQLLDLGLIPTMAREAARQRAGAISAHDFRRFLRALEGLFLAMSVIAGTALFLGAGFVSRHWLRIEALAPEQALDGLRLMALCVSMKLIGELYRGAISGFERLSWLAGMNALFGTLRLVLVIPFLAWVGNTPTHFLGFQLIVIILETLALMAQAYRLVPDAGPDRIPWRIAPIRKMLAFSVPMSLASLVWITLSQLDKLLLSGLLRLADYGEFSVAVAAAAGVLIVSGSLSDVLLPRLTNLRARAAHADLKSLYRQATQWAGISAWSAACVLAFHADKVLWIWTGDAALSARAAPVLSLYALGNAALAVGAFPYYLQFAAGELRLHLIGTALMVAVLIPCMVWATSRYGGEGAAAVWFGVNLAYLLLWTPVAHARFMPSLHWRWMAEDVVPVVALAAAAAIACQWVPWPSGRLNASLVLLLVSLVVVTASAAGSSSARSALRSPVKHQA